MIYDDFCLLDDLFLGFYYSNLAQEIGGLFNSHRLSALYYKQTH